MDINFEELQKLPKTYQKEFGVGKLIKRKDDKLYIKWKGYYNSFDSWIDKRYIIKMSESFLEPKSFGGRMKFELDLSNYAAKLDLKYSSC